MIRKIIQIDEALCNGCGLCVQACHEGAIGLIGGKARLLRDDYCDGLGDCLPACPTGAITFIEREAAAYDEAAVLAAKREDQVPASTGGPMAGCPLHAQSFASIQESSTLAQPMKDDAGDVASPAVHDEVEAPSQLAQWPAEIKLVPVSAPYFEEAHLLIAADCTAFAYANFHTRFMQGRTTIIGCPKLDAVDYSEKLSQIIASNNIASVTVARMEVPCCGGLEHAARLALERTGKNIPFDVVTISTRGVLL